MDDINSLDSTFLKLELYPEDPDAPTSSNFDKTKAGNRTIDYCIASPSIPGAGGQASSESSGGKRTKCTIKMKSSTQDDPKGWSGTFVHEVGHCLGLAHPQDSVDAIMSYFGKSKWYRYRPDDLAGIAFQYPKKLAGKDHSEEATFGLKCSFK